MRAGIDQAAVSSVAVVFGAVFGRGKGLCAARDTFTAERAMSRIGVIRIGMFISVPDATIATGTK